MVNKTLVILASLAFIASSPVSADGLHSSLSFPQCTDIGLSSNFTEMEPLEFDVLRKGKKIGTHEIKFNKSDEGLKVRARTKMKVKLLFVTVFKYEYVSEELWCGNRLLTVKTSVNDNGKKSMTQLAAKGEGFLVQTDEEFRELSTQFYPTNHWNSDVVEASTSYNTITGKLNPISYTPTRETEMQTALGPKAVIEYAVEGEFSLRSFYDRAGNWSGMAFEHQDGSPIEFRCVKCGLPKQLTIAVNTSR